MASPAYQGQLGDEGELDRARPHVTTPGAGLQASELELLRSLPDFDAEEMASERSPAGWQQVTEAAAATIAADATPWVAHGRLEAPASPGAWAPPNRVEAPTDPSSWAASEPAEEP